MSMNQLAIRGPFGSLTYLRERVSRMCAGTITIHLASAAHIYIALALFIAGDKASGSVGVDAMMRLHQPTVDDLSRETVVGLLCLICAGMALVALYTRWLPHVMVAALLLPQQVLLFVTCGGAISAIWHGHYADGYVPHGGSWFISTDQVWSIVLAPSYTAASFSRAMRHEHSVLWR